MNAAKNTVRALPQNLHAQRGASLLEGIAYLGIAAIVILGAVSLLTGAFSSAQSNQATEEATAIRTAVRKLYLGQGYAAGLLNVPLRAARAFPGTLTMGAVAGAVTNVWGGPVVVTGIANNQFTISYADVPEDVCINTLVGASGWTGIAVGGAAQIVAFPITAAVAASAAACVAGNNTIVFTSL